MVESGTKPPETFVLLVGSKSAAGSEQEAEKDDEEVFELETEDQLMEAGVPVIFSSGGGKHELVCSKSLLESKKE